MRFNIKSHVSMHRTVLILFYGVAASVVANAAPVTIVDVTPTSATNNGAVGAGEYVGYSVGINSGFGNVVGSASELHIDSSDSGALHLGLRRGLGTFNDEAVIYIDSAPGGFADTMTLSDTQDTLRGAISGNAIYPGDNSELTFAPGFAADYAIGFNEGFGGLWKLAAGGNNSLQFLRSVNLNPLNQSSAAALEMDLLLSDIGVAPGGSFRYVLSYMNAEDFGLFRSNEFHGVSQATVPGGNPGRTNLALAAGDFNTFQSYAAIPEPASAGLIVVAGLAGMALTRQRILG
jgi:hypothetical protein